MPIDHDDIEPLLTEAQEAFRYGGQTPEEGLDISSADLVQLRGDSIHPSSSLAVESILRFDLLARNALVVVELRFTARRSRPPRTSTHATTSTTLPRRGTPRPHCVFVDHEQAVDCYAVAGSIRRTMPAKSSSKLRTASRSWSA